MMWMSATDSIERTSDVRWKMLRARLLAAVDDDTAEMVGYPQVVEILSQATSDLHDAYRHAADRQPF